MEQNYIEKELAKYNLPDAKIAELKAEYLPLVVKSVDDTETYLACKEAHQEVKKIRIAIDAKRKELKADSIAFGRAVEGEANRLTEGVREVEDHLLAQRKVVEDEAKRIQEELAKREREEEERIKREEEEKLEAQRKEQEETARKQKEAQDRIDEEKRANEQEKQKNRDEAERLEKEKRDAEEAKERAKREEAERIERERKHAEDLKIAEEAAKEKAIKDERERVEREAQEKKAKEEAEAIESVRQEALKPDKEKLAVLGNTLFMIVLPEVSSPEAKGVLLWAKCELEKIIDELTEAKL